MNKLMKKLKDKKGVSFLEVMIALLITGILTASMLRLYITQHKNYMIQEDVTEIQQNARASIGELSRQIRMAGYDLPIGLEGIKAYNTNPDTLIIVYQGDDCDTYLSNSMPNTSAELKVGTDPSCFYDGQWVFIYDADSAQGEWFEITHVQVDAKHIQHNTMQLSRKYGANALLLSITQVKYYIDNTSEPDHPKFMMQFMGQPPQVFAENITDLQFRYKMKNGATVDNPSLTQNIREIIIDISGRSDRPEVDDEGHESFRNRSFSTSVFLRNIGI